MPRRSRRNGRKSKFVTKRSLPFQLMKYAETKQFTTTFDPLTLTTSGTSFDLSELEQGPSVFERIGNECQLRSVYCRFTITKNAAETMSNASFARFILYTPRLANDSTVPVAKLTSLVDKDDNIVWQDKWVRVASDLNGGSGLVTIKHKWKPYMKLIWNAAGESGHRKGSLRLCIIGSNLNCDARGFATMFFKDL